jgi:hypothetical protein
MTKVFAFIEEGKFLFLLVALILTIAVAPLLGNFVALRMLMNIFITTVFIAAIYAVSEKRRQGLIASLLALPMVVAIWADLVGKLPGLAVVGNAFGILFIGYTLVLILSFIVRQKEITRDTIYAGIVGYLLIGVMWAFAFLLLDELQPGSFRVPEEHLAEPRYLFYYHSFVTLTTLGYGDVTPITGEASSLSVLEALIGQIYLTVLIAMLVGVYISQSLAGKSE